MKPRTKEQETEYRRRLRARKKVVPSPVPPVVCPPENVPPGSGSMSPPDFIENSRTGKIDNLALELCQNCAEKDAEISRLHAQIATLEDQQQATCTAAGRHAEKITQDDTEALHQPVIAAKVERINNYSRGHLIGSTRA